MNLRLRIWRKHSYGSMQKQIQRLFQNVLDIDLGKKASVQDLMASYYNQAGSDTLNTFQFRTLPLKFEPVDSHNFTEVLYPGTVYDLIDYFLRECVLREQRMRVCKNCGLYFAVKGRADFSRGALRLGREGQREKSGVRGGEYLAGGVSGVAEGSIACKML